MYSDPRGGAALVLTKFLVLEVGTTRYDNTKDVVTPTKLAKMLNIPAEWVTLEGNGCFCIKIPPSKTPMEWRISDAK